MDVKRLINEVDVNRFNRGVKTIDITKGLFSFLLQYDKKYESDFNMLVRAYFIEFSDSKIDDICAVIRCSDKDKPYISNIVNLNRRRLSLPKYPKILVLDNKLPLESVLKSVGVYVSFDTTLDVCRAMACGTWILTKPNSIFTVGTPYSMDRCDEKYFRAKLRVLHNHKNYNPDNILADFNRNRTVENQVVISETEPVVSDWEEIEYASNGLYNIEIIAPILDPSGYGSAARTLALALDEYGYNVSIKNMSFDPQRPDLGGRFPKIKKLIDKKIYPDVKLFIVTPNIPVGSMEKDTKCLNVLYFFWETDQLPDEWIPYLDHYDLILTPCKYHEKMIRKANGKLKVATVGQVVDIERHCVRTKQKDLDKFVFYSIFQWTERKNPAGLLRAYWSEFKGCRDVVLVLKTYLANTSPEQADMIKKFVADIKHQFPLSVNRLRKEEDFPEVRLVTEMLSSDAMVDMHVNGDCFVLLHRGEGFGLPIVEAMASGRPPIATTYFACEDYLTKDNSYPVEYWMTPVYNMAHIPWYCGIQNWAEPNMEQAKKHMRNAYENRGEVAIKGLRARKTVEDQYSSRVFGDRMTEVLNKHVKKEIDE